MNRNVLEARSAVVAAIGVVGELTLLRHLLVDSYPFKLFTYPPASFYEHLGNVGSFVVLGLMALLASVVARKASWPVPLIVTAFAPLTYLALLVATTSAIYGWVVPPEMRNYDDYQIAAATLEFARTAVGLATGGFVIGGTCSVILWHMTRRKTIQPNTT
jgi:hypothetical protein